MKAAGAAQKRGVATVMSNLGFEQALNAGGIKVLRNAVATLCAG